MEGRKTQTRRPVKPQPVLGKPWHSGAKWWVVDPDKMDLPRAFNPLGIPGDLLYVRETWIKIPDPDPELGGFEIRYRATDSVDSAWYGGWRPSIHMPKWAARTWLMVTGVRVERVQDISEDDVIAEGVRRVEEIDFDRDLYKVHFESDAGKSSCPFEAYAWLWDSIYAKRGLGWDANPWVFVTSYEVTENG